MLQLSDDQSVAEIPADVMHPPWPHFHPKNPLAVFEPFKYKIDEKTQAPTWILEVHKNTDQGAARVDPNGFFEVSNLLIHNREFAPANVGDPPGGRKFKLFQKPQNAAEPQPIPSPPYPMALGNPCFSPLMLNLINLPRSRPRLCASPQFRVVQMIAERAVAPDGRASGVPGTLNSFKPAPQVNFIDYEAVGTVKYRPCDSCCQ